MTYRTMMTNSQERHQDGLSSFFFHDEPDGGIMLGISGTMDDTWDDPPCLLL